MSLFQEYLQQISDNKELQSTVKNTASDFWQKSESLLASRNYTNYLILGNVQSGKTAQILGIISTLADRGFNLFFYLTTDSVDLQKQTLDRIKESLTGFWVLDENEHHDFDSGIKLQKPVVVVLKKNSRILKKWRDELVNKPYLKGYQSFIIDDEADAASLNTQKSKNTGKTSPINQHLSDIKNATNKSFFIELTATPQAILLQDKHSDWRPNAIQYFEPGSQYVGGNAIYTEPVSFVVKLIDSDLIEALDEENQIIPELAEAVLTYLIVCADFWLRNKTNCNFMIHPSHKTSVHNIYKEKIEDFFNSISHNFNYGESEHLEEQIKQIWLGLKSTKPDIQHFEDIIEKLKNIVSEQIINILTLNSKSNTGFQLSRGFNIIIGGNVVSRGLTIPSLQTVFYCRSSKKPNADTYWQHSRIFGYDRDKALIRLYMPRDIYKFFYDLNETNNSLIQQVTNPNQHNIQFFYPDNIQPTRRNVLERHLYLIKGGKNYFPLFPNESNLKKVSKIISNLNNIYQLDENSVIQIDSDDMICLIKALGKYKDFDWNKEKFLSSILTLSSKRPKTKNYLIVRTNRKLSKSTGTMLSPDDRRLGAKYKNDIVLTIYQIVGDENKGWDGKNFWMPNIKLPEKLVFWDAI